MDYSDDLRQRQHSSALKQGQSAPVSLAFEAHTGRSASFPAGEHDRTNLAGVLHLLQCAEELAGISAHPTAT